MSHLNTRQAAERLGLKVYQIITMIKAKRLIAEKVGRDYIIEEESLSNATIGLRGRPPTKEKVVGKKRKYVKKNSDNSGKKEG